MWLMQGANVLNNELTTQLLKQSQGSEATHKCLSPMAESMSSSK